MRLSSGGWLLGVVFVVAFCPLGDGRREHTATFHLIDLDQLVAFVSDSVPRVSSENCTKVVSLEYVGRDEIFLDPLAAGLEPACKNQDPRRLLRFDSMCADLAQHGTEGYCKVMDDCDLLRKKLTNDKPFQNVTNRFFVMEESEYVRNRTVSIYMHEDALPGQCEGFLREIQAGDSPRPTNSTGTRTVISGDLMVMKVAREGVTEKECVYVSEDRRSDDRFTVSHRVRIDDSEKDEVQGTEARFRSYWAAKVGLWEDTIIAEFTEDVQARKNFLELRVRRISAAKAKMLAKVITRADVLGVVLKVRPSFAQSFSPDGQLWYRVDGGGIMSVAFGRWRKLGSFDMTTMFLGVASIAAIAIVAIIVLRKRRKRPRGYQPAAQGMIPTPDEDEEDQDEDEQLS